MIQSSKKDFGLRACVDVCVRNDLTNALTPKCMTACCHKVHEMTSQAAIASFHGEVHPNEQHGVTSKSQSYGEHVFKSR